MKGGSWVGFRGVLPFSWRPGAQGWAPHRPSWQEQYCGERGLDKHKTKLEELIGGVKEQYGVRSETAFV